MRVASRFGHAARLRLLSVSCPLSPAELRRVAGGDEPDAGGEVNAVAVNHESISPRDPASGLPTGKPLLSTVST